MRELQRGRMPRGSRPPTLCLLFLVPTAACLEGIQNFRRVSPSLPGLYRSAALERATAADAAFLLDGAKIRTIIDLRNDDEIDRARARDSTAFGRAIIEAYDRRAPVGSGELASEGSGTLRRVHVPILQDVDGFFDAVDAQLSPAKKAQALAYKAFDMKRYNQLLYDEVANGRQQLLYTLMLQTSAEWERALSLAADRRHGAVLIHCAQGKDRTGVLAALLQHAAGDAEADIVASYASSEQLLSRPSTATAARAEEASQSPPQDEKGAAVDWSALRGSPPEAMARTLEWLRKEHGAIDNFLASVGCREQWRQMLLRPPPFG